MAAQSYHPSPGLDVSQPVRHEFEAIARALGAHGDTLVALGARGHTLTPMQVAQVQQAVQSNGAAPIVLTGLVGANASGGATLVGTHADRLANANYAPTAVPQGATFFETDRSALYVATETSGGVPIWRLVWAYMISGSTPTDLGANDTNFLVVLNNQPMSITLRWTGSQYNYFTGSIIIANFSTRPSTQLDEGVYFIASDYGNQVWLWNGSAWTLKRYIGGPMQGTINPDQKPTLGASDGGFQFFAYDYGRLYEWSGSAWSELGGEARYQVGLFEQNPAQGGWFLSDGSTYVQSNGDGTTANYVTTDHVSGSPLVRTAGAVGAGATVANGVDSVSQKFLPYIRL